MTQDATTPLAALQHTLHNFLHPEFIANSPIGHVKIGNLRLMNDHPEAEGADAFLTTPGATVRHDGSADFYSALDHLEAEGTALLQTAETHIEDAGHTIVEIGNHALHPRTIAPHHIDMARALPLARAGDVLHESEHAVIRAFMDAEDVLRRVYLNVHGWWVKA